MQSPATGIGVSHVSTDGLDSASERAGGGNPGVRSRWRRLRSARRTMPSSPSNRFVPHTSTVPANEGERVGLFLHEKLSRELADRIAAGERPEGRVVLFVHGGSIPSVPDYDLPYKDYSWMEHLAAAGFDTFSMDQTGYGLSPRPMMDDPCNMAADDRAIVTPNPLAGDCEPSYRHGLTTQPVGLGRDRTRRRLRPPAPGRRQGESRRLVGRRPGAPAASRRAIPTRSTSWCCSRRATGGTGRRIRRR